MFDGGNETDCFLFLSSSFFFNSGSLVSSESLDSFCFGALFDAESLLLPIQERQIAKSIQTKTVQID